MAAGDFNFDFMGYRKGAASISLVLVLLSIGNLAVNQVNWGLDFTGGTLVEVYYGSSVSPEAIRVELKNAGYIGHVVQYFGSDQDVLVELLVILLSFFLLLLLLLIFVFLILPVLMLPVLFYLLILEVYSLRL